MQYTFSILQDTAQAKVFPATLEKEILAANIPGFQYIATNGDVMDIFFDAALAPSDETLLTTTVSNHQGLTPVESLQVYLDNSVFPFVKTLINNFAAENIALGITQAGKTADVLGLFEKKYDIGALHPVSLKASFDTGSLYVALDVIQHVRDNPTEFTGLSPFVTDARLLEMKNKIETFLGLGLSV